MIIIKLIILHFIQIRHTDDFPSTGTRLVHLMTLTEIASDDLCAYLPPGTALWVV